MERLDLLPLGKVSGIEVVFYNQYTVDYDFNFTQSTIIRELRVAKTRLSGYFLSRKCP